MIKAPITSSFYKVGGALPQDVPSYVIRESDCKLYEALKAEEFCYVLNSRQTGKSSLMVRTFAKLQAEGWAGMTIDFSAKDSQTDRSDYWYNGIINKLNGEFKLLERKDFRVWLKERDFISPVERLGEFIETVLLPGIKPPIVIFIDEIDSTLKLPFTDDFFALIRSCYNKRAENPNYKRLTFALFGVAAPSDLISDAQRTPFNIGKNIDLKGFTLQEALPLATGLAVKSERPQKVLQEILYWTGGQPFLTQRLCQLVVDSSFPITSGSEAKLIEKLIISRVIEHWESQDQQEHLKTIRRRLLDNEQKAGYLLELYRKIRRSGKITAHDHPEEQELRLTGLVVKRDGKLQVYNSIYEAVFDEAWINLELANLRPYAGNYQIWLESDKTDTSRLLRGQALKDAELWSSNKNLGAEDLEFLVKSQLKEKEEEIADKAKEAELEREIKAREAAEKAQQRIVIGSIVLGIALIAPTIVTGWGYWQSEKTKTELEKVENSIQAVKEIFESADKLRETGDVEASVEALRKVGLSVLIEDEQLKKAWLFAAIAEADSSLGNEERKSDQKIKKSLGYLNDIPAEPDSKIFNQVKAFANFQAGRLLNEKNYKVAYDALKSSNFNPYNSNRETDILTEKDVENIHYQLIKSENIDMNSETNPIAKDFRKHLYAGLESLLNQDRLQEADEKTYEIMLYLGKQKERGFLTWDSKKRIPCKALKKIDAIWYSYPRRKKHFGFRVQKEIWHQNGNPTINSSKEDIRSFYIDVGWKTINSGIKSHNGYLLYPELSGFKNLDLSIRGNLPFGGNRKIRSLGSGMTLDILSRCEF